MADRMNLVHTAALTGTVPAARPIDHARRISAGLALGLAIGTVAAVMFFDVDLREARTWIGGGIVIFAMIAVLTPWIVRPRSSSEAILVVARTLGTKESVQSRFVQRGSARTGLLVPVIVKPVDGSTNFRSVILLRDVDPKNPQDPPVGTLLALQQTEPGMGELENVAEVSDEQRKIIDRLRKHPRELANDASILPMRRGTLEFTPWWAGLEFWAGIPIGFFAAAAFMLVMGRG
ncbi:hypothetical protein I6E29_07155 [Arcanobacterium haemolyticum]|nr:hypothetical protein [Arcanobacterium haemolyticum]